jgi:predicted nucleic acid-binding protein
MLRAVASTVALLEVLIVPLRNGDAETAQAYRNILLNNDAMTLMLVSPEVAERAAKLRARYTVRTPDALHLATALHAGATHFITNDTRLPALAELQVITLDSLAADIA